MVLGETWIKHHGEHGKQSTRGVLNPKQTTHPILSGIHNGELWSTTDVYEVRLPLPGDSNVLVLGEALAGMEQNSSPAAGAVNDPMMPIAWVKTYTGSSGKASRVFATTLGTSQDLLIEADRRLFVNACYWALGMEGQIRARSNVSLVGEYRPRPFGTKGYVKGVRPADLRSVR